MTKTGSDRIRKTIIKNIKQHPVMLRFLMDGWEKLRVDIYADGAAVLIGEKWVPALTKTRHLDGTVTEIQGKALRPEIKALSHRHHTAFARQNEPYMDSRWLHYNIYLTDEDDLLRHTGSVLSDLSRFLHTVDNEE